MGSRQSPLSCQCEPLHLLKREILIITPRPHTATSPVALPYTRFRPSPLWTAALASHWPPAPMLTLAGLSVGFLATLCRKHDRGLLSDQDVRSPVSGPLRRPPDSPPAPLPTSCAEAVVRPSWAPTEPCLTSMPSTRHDSDSKRVGPRRASAGPRPETRFRLRSDHSLHHHGLFFL